MWKAITHARGNEADHATQQTDPGGGIDPIRRADSFQIIKWQWHDVLTTVLPGIWARHIRTVGLDTPTS